MSLLSFTQLPEIFAQEVVQQATAVSATIKRQRVINLYKTKSGSGSTASTARSKKSNQRQKGLSGVITTGIVLPYTGTGSCVWDMAAMQWTGFQTHTGMIDHNQRTGSRSGFDSQTMGLSYGTGILLYQALVDSGNYLTMYDCIRSGGQIIYPGEQEYLSGLILFSGELLDLPLVFSGVKTSMPYVSLIVDQISGISGSNKIHSGDLRRDRDQGVTTIYHNNDSKHIVQNPQELLSKIEAGVVVLQQQKVKRPRDTGKPNKLQLTDSLTYVTSGSILSAELSSGTTIFTAQGQELQISKFSLQELNYTPSHKTHYQVSAYSKDMIEWGIAGDHLIFTQPIMITYQSDLPDGSPVWLQVQHAGQEWSTQGLSLNPNTQCDLEGNTSLPGSKTSVQGGQIQFYTCGASAFSFTYTGGANTGNFVLSGTLAKTIRVNTGDVSSGFLVQKVQVVVDWRAIASADPTNPGGGTASLSDKYFTITSPQGVTRTLVAANTYQGEGTSHRVVMTFDDDANQSPSFTAESGRFTPNQSLSVYSGTNPIGNWTLTMGSNSMFAGVTLYGFNVILLKPECGDGFPNKAEQCDDGNTTGGDGCSASCTVEYYCGNGVINTTTGGIAVSEQCDDANAILGDGCNTTCQVEPTRTCSGTPSVCSYSTGLMDFLFFVDGTTHNTYFVENRYGYSMINSGGVTTGLSNGETVMCFNGTNQSLFVKSQLVASYPFTMSAWVKSSTITNTRGIVSYGRRTASTRMFNIEHSTNVIRQRAQNTTARYTNATSVLNTTGWRFITVEFPSATLREIYIDGVLQGTNTTSVTMDTDPDMQLTIGAFSSSAPAGSFFSGCIDNVSLYGKNLTTGQIQNLHSSFGQLTTNVVSTGSPALSGTITSPLDRIVLTISGTNYTGINRGDGTWSLSGGLISPALTTGSKAITMRVINAYDKSFVYSSSFYVQKPSAPSAPIGTLCIQSPNVLWMSGTQGVSGGIWETQFNYFEVDDYKGINSGYYTTLSMTALGGPGGSTIDSSLVQWKGDTIATLSGSTNPRVVVGSAMSGSYAPANNVTTFIKRDTAANSSIIGEYGSKLWLKVSVPQYQTIGSYTGAITYTLYEN